jgi:hypothetical protein
MTTQSVSLTILLDWDNLTTRDYARMDKVRSMFGNMTVDSYGRDGETKAKVWIVQGTTSHTFISFAQHLADIFPIDAVTHYGVAVNS